MTAMKRFFLGGLGAVLPVAVWMLTLDIPQYLSSSHFSTGEMLGASIRGVLLFLLGGFVAYLHDDENKSFKLVELGIAAPALIASLAAGSAANNALEQNRREVSFNLSIVSSAYAQSNEHTIIAGGFLGDVLRGVTGEYGTGRELDEVHRKSKATIPDSNADNSEIKKPELINKIGEPFFIAAPDGQAYEVKAAAKKAANKASPASEYEFTISINASTEQLKKIKKVKYGFFHPSFKKPVVSANNPENHFSFSYNGWGCLNDVRVKLDFKNGSSSGISTFNMCRALGPEWSGG